MLVKEPPTLLLRGFLSRLCPDVPLSGRTPRVPEAGIPIMLRAPFALRGTGAVPVGAGPPERPFPCPGTQYLGPTKASILATASLRDTEMTCMFLRRGSEGFRTCALHVTPSRSRVVVSKPVMSVETLVNW